jgi:hypothetical protein
MRYFKFKFLKMDQTSKDLKAKLMYARGKSPSEAGYSTTSPDFKTP